MKENPMRVTDREALEGYWSPFAIESVRFANRSSAGALWCHAVVREGKAASGESFTADLRLVEEQGHVVADIRGFEVRKLPQETLRRSSRSEPIDWLYRVAWEPRPAGRAREAAGDGAWLVMGDDGGIGARLAKQVEVLGGRAFVVRRGDVYSAPSTGDWTIDVASATDYARMLEEIRCRSSTPLRGVFHLWSLDSEQGLSDGSGFLRAQSLGSESVLLLVQALERAALESSPRLEARGDNGNA